jgi:hypothetical protein
MRLMTGDGDRACETAVLDAHGERPGGTQDVPVQHGLAASRGGHRLEPVWLQFFLAGSGTGPRGRVGPPGRREPGDGGHLRPCNTAESPGDCLLGRLIECPTIRMTSRESDGWRHLNGGARCRSSLRGPAGAHLGRLAVVLGPAWRWMSLSSFLATDGRDQRPRQGLCLIPFPIAGHGLGLDSEPPRR